MISPVPRPTTRTTLALTWLALFAIGLFVLVSALDPALGLPLAFDRLAPWTVAALNALPALLLMLALAALTRRVLLASWLTLLLVGALYAANAAKLAQLEMPLLPGDFLFLRDIGAGLPLFGHYLAHDRAHLVLALGLVAITLFLCREPALAALRGWRRWGLLAVTLALGASLIQGAGPWRRVYDADRLGFQPWSVVDSANHAGLVGNLLLYRWQGANRRSAPPDRAAAAELLQRHAAVLQTRLGPAGPGAVSAADLPDIVVVQSESLFDPARLTGAPQGVYLPNYRRLAGGGLSGNLHVPTFGGGTIRTEWEVLTGLALDFFPGVQYPYFELADKPLPGLVRTLAAHGYRTTAIHPNAGVFWNRNQAFRALGFDRFIDGRAFDDADIVGLFTGDAALTDHILDELGDDGPPQFVFAISMENHGPFDWRPGLDAQRLAAQKLPAGLDEGGRYWLRNYLYLMDDADHELGRLADALAKRKRRTLLLFYGDHLPALGPVYAQLGFADGREAKAQSVPWLLLDNRRKSRTPEHEDTVAWLLPALLLETAGIRDDRYFAALDALRTVLPLGANLPPRDLTRALAALGQLRYRGELDRVFDRAFAGEDGTLAALAAPAR